ncbi:MAG: hypothetical protein JST92_12970 [Deltaproteobacteria bacterium]|nr:hypothetical protein [Deltaproteobacteria bacterium]
MSVYLSISPPDGFTRWNEPEWDRWLRDHPWEAAERICSRGDWAIFLYQVRALSDKAKKFIEPHLDSLVNERPLDTQACDGLRLGFELAEDELAKKPAELLRTINNQFASAEDLDAMIQAARSRTGKEPTASDVWTEVFDAVGDVLEAAGRAKRGVYFGNL